MLSRIACDSTVLAAGQAYECLATLEGTSTLAQQALVGIKALNRDELRNLSVYFNRVCSHHAHTEANQGSWRLHTSAQASALRRGLCLLC